jgi:uncharacterized protein with HEPN domain
MSHRSIELLIQDLWEAVEKIERYTNGVDHDDFVQDEKTIDSVVRNFEIIGEVANRLPGDFRDQNPGIEWKKIIGLRHRIVHDYFDIDVEIIWQIIEQLISDFKGKLSSIKERLGKEKDKDD